MQRPLAAVRGFLRPHIELPGLRWRHVRPEPLGDPALLPFATGHDLFADAHDPAAADDLAAAVTPDLRGTGQDSVQVAS
jgi:hypothetical protein